MFESFQSMELIQELGTVPDEKRKRTSDIVVEFFLQSPFGKKYQKTYVQSSEKVSLSRLYEIILSNPEQIQLTQDSHVIKIDPICDLNMQIPEYSKLTVHDVSKFKKVDSNPIECFIFHEPSVTLVKCLSKQDMDKYLERILLVNFNKSIDGWVQQNIEKEKNDDW